MPTTGDPITVGTLDLRDFCGCQTPCEPCCTTICGCTGIAVDLHGEITNNDKCECVAGTTFTLTFDEGTTTWDSGSISLGSCGKTIRFVLSCTGSTPSEFKLAITGCQSLNLFPDSASCDGFELAYSIGTSAGNCCDGGGLIQTMNVTITL